METINGAVENIRIKLDKIDFVVREVEIRVCGGALSRIKTEESSRLGDNSINANYREFAGCCRVEQRRQIGVRAGEPR